MAAKDMDVQTEPQFKPQGGPPTGVTQRSFVANGITVDGKVTGRGDLVIGGRLKGEVHLAGHQVDIEESGNVDASIEAETIVIQGSFKGSLNAKGLVQLKKTAKFEGELRAARLQMEDGAKLKGSVELVQ